MIIFKPSLINTRRGTALKDHQKTRTMYRIPKRLIKSLSHATTVGINEQGEKYQAVQMLPELEKYYSDQYKPEIISVRFYQTEKACYLETTIDEYKEKGIDPENKNPANPYEEYSRVTYRIHRDSLAFISGGDELAYNPKKPVLKNAADFLITMDPYSLINCTNLLTNQAANKISEEYIAKQKDHTNLTTYISWEIRFSGESLKGLDDYDSDDDPEFIKTPMARITIHEELTEIHLTKLLLQTENDPPSVQGDLPSFIEISCTLSPKYSLTYC